MATALISYANKRSKVVAAFAFAFFVLFFLFRIGGGSSAGLYGEPKPAKEEPPPKPVYSGPRIELFGLKDFGAEVEIATLNIRVKEQQYQHTSDRPVAKNRPAANNKPAAAADPVPVKPAPPTSPEVEHSRPGHPRRQGYGIFTPSPLQQQLPIALPKFRTHRLDVPDFNETDLNTPVPGTPPATTTITIPPKKKAPDASRITFGVATLLSRMPDALQNFKHWAAHTNARFVVVHEPQDTEARPGEPSPDEVKTMFREAGIGHLFLVESAKGWGERYLSLLGLLSSTVERQTDWVALIDDDTFFFDMNTLMGMLNKYDPAEEWYLGRLSENKWNINNGGFFAIGGAGVFMSRPLIEKLGPHAQSCWDARGDAATGADWIVGDCVYRHTTTKLNIEHGLFQLDLHVDVTGFYEAVRKQPISAHHWKSWHHHDLPTVASVSEVCGKPCVLQNFRFQDGWQMANGFSIVRYSYSETELAAQHPEAMEHTWKKTIWDIEDSWTHSLAPLKPRDEGKVQFLVEKSVRDEAARTTTMYYVRRGEEGIGKGLIRVVWQEAS
ncbi:hypothetical protein DHEL01_v202591 [Diaporthe helianthi]|uniref:Fringe-like glycosyltransferase domain-containing protein n=1 Tax=Diaporthe helianthi TaxID=158607 RepID=A0A2P5I948_DIAHE|nr:hypothetical protein DHEL01_v202591 [Diaporthe helianthi]